MLGNILLLRVLISASSWDVASQIFLAAKGAAVLFLAKPSPGMYSCFCMSQGLVAQLPISEVEGIPTHGCIYCGLVPKRITALLSSVAHGGLYCERLALPIPWLTCSAL